MEFYVNNRRFSPFLVREIDCLTLLQDFLKQQVNIYTCTDFLQMPNKVFEKATYTSLEKKKLSRLRNLASIASKCPYPSFYYQEVPVSSEDLFYHDSQGVKKIKDKYLPYLPFLVVRSIDFSHSHLEGVDLSNTNIHTIDFSTLENHSIRDTNFCNVNLFIRSSVTKYRCTWG